MSPWHGVICNLVHSVVTDTGDVFSPLLEQYRCHQPFLRMCSGPNPPHSVSPTPQILPLFSRGMQRLLISSASRLYVRLPDEPMGSRLSDSAGQNLASPLGWVANWCHQRSWNTTDNVHPSWYRMLHQRLAAKSVCFGSSQKYLGDALDSVLDVTKAAGCYCFRTEPVDCTKISLLCYHYNKYKRFNVPLLLYIFANSVNAKWVGWARLTEINHNGSLKFNSLT